MVLGKFNNDAMTYNIGPLPDIEFERLPSLKKADAAFCEEAKNYHYINEKCRIGRLYIPIKDGKSNYFTSIVLMHFENMDKWFVNMVDAKPEKIGDYMFAYLDDIFKEHGMPDEIEIADRHIFSAVTKTLEKLHISTTVVREENEFARGCYEKL